MAQGANADPKLNQKERRNARKVFNGQIETTGRNLLIKDVKETGSQQLREQVLI